MKRILLLPIIFVLLTVPASAQKARESEQYSVYTAIIQDFYLGKQFLSDEVKELVIKKQTEFNNPMEEHLPQNFLTKEFPTLQKETIEEFYSLNKQSVELTNKFNLKLKINFIGEEINQIFNNRNSSTPKEDGWEIFRKKYPLAYGFMRLSRVSFNKEKSQALTYFAHGCGWVCGKAYYVFLVKKDDKWKV